MGSNTGYLLKSFLLYPPQEVEVQLSFVKTILNKKLEANLRTKALRKKVVHTSNACISNSILVGAEQ